MKKDIETRADIEKLIDEFYLIVPGDAMIGHHFDGLDLAAHLPIMYDFWEKTLFARPVYFGNPMAVHQTLHERSPLTPEHFGRWVEIFIETVDRLFEGELAENAKLRARMIADSINLRLNQEQRFDQLDSYGRSY